MYKFFEKIEDVLKAYKAELLSGNYFRGDVSEIRQILDESGMKDIREEYDKRYSGYRLGW